MSSGVRILLFFLQPAMETKQKKGERERKKIEKATSPQPGVAAWSSFFILVLFARAINGYQGNPEGSWGIRQRTRNRFGRADFFSIPVDATYSPLIIAPRRAASFSKIARNFGEGGLHLPFNRRWTGDLWEISSCESSFCQVRAGERQQARSKCTRAKSAEILITFAFAFISLPSILSHPSLSPSLSFSLFIALSWRSNSFMR